MTGIEKLFMFAAKAGSLEGYVYDRDTADSLDNWVDNIQRMYSEFSDARKKEIREPLKGVLERTISRAGTGLDARNKARIAALLQSLQ